MPCLSLKRKRAHAKRTQALRGRTEGHRPENTPALQHRALAQCYWPCCAARFARGGQTQVCFPRDHKLLQARSQRQLRRSQQTSLFAHSSNEARMISPRETEAGPARTQPCWWADRDDHCAGGGFLSRSAQDHVGLVDSNALKILAQRAKCPLMESPPCDQPHRQSASSGR